MTTSNRLLYWILVLPLSVFLFAALAYGNGEKIHARLMVLGESLFTGYFALQSDPVEPKCDLPSPTSQQAQAPDELDDLLGDDPSPKSNTQHQDELDALLDDGKNDQNTQEQANQSKAAAFLAAQKLCEEKKANYLNTKNKITASVKLFRSLEKGIGYFVSWMVDHFKHILVLIMIFGTLIASIQGHHISLRNPEDRISYRLSELFQFIAFVFVFLSMLDYRQQLIGEERLLNLVWLIGLALLMLLHLFRLIKGDSRLAPKPKSLVYPLLSIPLYAQMAMIAGLYFLKIKHFGGLAIEMTKLTEHAILYVHVALYVWIGMLLKQSPLSKQVFALISPWKLAPSILTVVLVIFAAIPTAYSGASGIFVIAVGGVIYQDLIKAGASRQMALGATAMSGSMGVVLSPCLLVVIIASLNKQVTTDLLYGWGLKVFMLTAFLFTVITLSKHKKGTPWLTADYPTAKAESQQAILKLLPAFTLSVLVILFYAFILNSHVDEHSAPMILPVVLLVILIFSSYKTQIPSLKTAVNEATEESGSHIGALLMLMTFSVCIGGVIERAELMSLFPSTFSSVWMTVTALLFVLIFIGMIMDPYGAVILVSATIAQVAYQNQIDPIHFWVMVMVAFELGYLTPPVALNHLLTRQVVGGDEVDLADQEGDSFWAKNERIITPIFVMGIALLIVAYLPLFFYKN
jgi:TRAP-type C4-dicarboxylate transport system permease large subunit